MTAIQRNAHGKIKTSGAWNPDAPYLFFQSAQIADVGLGVLDVNTNVLVDAHELHPAKHTTLVNQVVDQGHALLIDSGVHNYLTDLVRVGDPFADWFDADPDTIPDYDERVAELPGYQRFVARHDLIAHAFAHRVWGIIEVDLGSPALRRARRAELAQDGIVCIPGWRADMPLALLDELASTYDRVTIGGVQAHTREGHQTLAALWEHCHARYADTWFHILGYTVNPYLLAYPLARSCDSSNWTSAMQWRGYYPRLDLKFFGTMPRGYRAITGAPTHPGGRRAVGRLSLWGAEMNGRNWQAHMASLDAALGPSDGD